MTPPPKRQSNLLIIVLCGAVTIGVAVYFRNFAQAPGQIKVAQPASPQFWVQDLRTNTRAEPVPRITADAPAIVNGEPAERPLPADVEATLNVADQDSELPTLIELLAHPQSEVRNRVCDKLGRLTPSATVVPPLLKLLADPDVSVRSSAIDALGVHGNESDEVIPALGKSLQNDKGPGVDYFCCSSLKKLAHLNPQRAAQAVAVLLNALEAAESSKIYRIVTALGDIGPAAEPAVPALVKLLGNSWGDTEIVGVLAQFGKFDVLTKYIDNQSTGRLNEKRSIAEGIGRMRPMSPEALGVLEKLFLDLDPKVRFKVAKSLEQCEPRLAAAIPLIERAQRDSDNDVRTQAAKVIALYETDPRRKIDRLLQQLAATKAAAWQEAQNLHAPIQEMQADGLRQILKISSAPETTDDIRRAAVLVLITPWDEAAYDDANRQQLVALLNNLELPLLVRAAVANTSNRAKISDPQIVPTLREVLDHPELELAVFCDSVRAIDPGADSLIQPLMNLAEQFEKPLPNAATPEEVEGRHARHTTVLYWLPSMSKVDGPKLLPRLLIAAQHGNFAVKQAALGALIQHGKDSPEALLVIRASTKDESKNVRALAIRLLGQLDLSTESIIAEICTALKDPDATVRSDAVATLRRMRSKAAMAVPDLIALLKPKPGQESTMGVPEALLAIAPHDVEVQQALMAAIPLEHYGGEIVKDLQNCRLDVRFAIPGLRQYFPQADDRLKFGIMGIFANIGEDAKAAIPEIAGELGDSDPDLRAHAAYALGRMRHHAQAYVPTLIKLIEDRSPEVQTNAIVALKQIGYPAKSAIPALETLLAKTNPDEVKQAATETLNRLQLDPGDTDPTLFFLMLDGGNSKDLNNLFAGRETEGLRVLTKLLSSRDESARHQAWYALTTMAESAAGQASLRQQLQGSDAPEQARAAVLLRQLPVADDRPALAKALVYWLRADQAADTALQLLGRLGSDSGPVVIDAILSPDTSPAERTRILYALDSYEFQSSTLLPGLQAALAGEQPDRQQLAALALAHINPREPGLLPQILLCLNSKTTEIRAEAVSALMALADAEVDVRAALPVLMTLLAETSDHTAGQPAEVEALFSSVARLMTEIGARPEDLPSLKSLLITHTKNGIAPEQEDNEEVQATVVRYGSALIAVIATLGPQAVDAVPEIKAFLASGKTGVSEEPDYECAAGLQKMGAPARRLLIELAEQPDIPLPSRKRAIALLIGFLDDSDVIAALSKLLDSQDPAIRKAAMHALVDQPQSFDQMLTVMRRLLVTAATPGAEEDFHLARQLIYRLGGQKSRAAAAIPELTQIVKQADVAGWLRASALNALVDIKPEDPEIRTLYFECLRTFPDDAQAAINADDLEVLGPDVVAELTRTVEQEPDPVRTRAAKLLGALEAKAISAVPALRKLMSTDAGPAGSTAAIAVARIDPTAEDVAPRVFAIYLEQGDEQDSAIAALRRLGSQAGAILPQLMELTKDDGHSHTAFDLIGQLGEAAKPALPLLQQAATAGQPNHSAGQALENLGPVAAELGPDLIARLRAGRDLNNYSPIIAKLGAPATVAVEELRTDLQDPDRRLRTIISLAQFGTIAAPAIPDLIPLAQQGDRSQRTAAINALRAIGPGQGECTDLFAAALADEDPGIAETAARGLAGLGSRAAAALPKAIAALQPPRLRTRSSVLQFLSNLGPAAGDAIPVLQSLLNHPDPEFRVEVRDCLEAIQPMSTR